VKINVIECVAESALATERTLQQGHQHFLRILANQSDYCAGGQQGNQQTNSRQQHQICPSR
jgi:hypothetical protein